MSFGPTPPFPQLPGMHYPFDPNYNYWYNTFAWWYYSGADHGTTYHQADAKISRISYSLAGLVARDRLTREQQDKLSSMKLKVFDFAVDGDMPAMLESTGVKVEAVKPTDVHLHVINQKLLPNQIVIINALYQPQPKDIFQAITNFVYEGGRLLIFNTASHLVSAMFPGRIAPVSPSTLISARVNFLGPEIELFSSWTPNELVDLEYYRYPIEIMDSREVKVLAEVKGRNMEPVSVQFDHGNGSVYLFVSRLFLHERKKNELVPADPSQKQPKEEVIPKEEIKQEDENEKKQNPFQQRRKKVPPPKKKQKSGSETPSDFDSYLNGMGASSDTFVAWRCAVSTGFVDAYNMAKRVLPSIEMLAKLLLKQQAIIEDMFVKPGEEERHDTSTLSARKIEEQPMEEQQE